MIDTHCHLNFQAFKDDYREVISRSFGHGIKSLIVIGSNYKTSLKAIEVAKEFKSCYAALGLHPIHVQDETFDFEKYHSLIRTNSRIIKAVGETGFDFYRHLENKSNNDEIKKIQEQIFIQHLKLAKEFNLPAILHCRGEVNNPFRAYEDLLFVIHNNKFTIPGVIHCFSAHWLIAQKFLNLGFYLGFTGIITFKNCDDYLLEVVEKTPLEKILIETDAPYLAPEPYRGQRCEPWQVQFTAQKIAEIKKITLEPVVEETTKKAEVLFEL
ncbi:MAG: TatD family hydrolase [Patescibacteria group bacterium]|nr:TatD family hydrolase [Patescibacteria group bacterium]